MAATYSTICKNNQDQLAYDLLRFEIETWRRQLVKQTSRLTSVTTIIIITSRSRVNYLMKPSVLSTHGHSQADVRKVTKSL